MYNYTTAAGRYTWVTKDIGRTSGFRGAGCAHPAPPTAADLWFFYAQNAKIYHFFLCSLSSRFILSLILIEIWQKHAKNDVTSTVNTFNNFLSPPFPLTDIVSIFCYPLSSLFYFIPLYIYRSILFENGPCFTSLPVVKIFSFIIRLLFYYAPFEEEGPFVSLISVGRSVGLSVRNQMVSDHYLEN